MLREQKWGVGKLEIQVYYLVMCSFQDTAAHNIVRIMKDKKLKLDQFTRQWELEMMMCVVSPYDAEEWDVLHKLLLMSY